MKKSILFLFLSITLFYSCSSGDDNSPQNQLKLPGTQWVKTTDNSRHFTFTSATEYVYSENGSTYPGTYVFNGTSGTMSETSSSFKLNFKINGEILSANQDTSNSDFEALYRKQ